MSTPMSHDRPILDSQSVHAAKLADVVRDHGQVVDQCNRGNLQVVWSNRFSALFKPVANIRVTIRGSAVERMFHEGAESLVDSRHAAITPLVFGCTVQQLCPHDRTSQNVADVSRPQMVGNRTCGVLEVLNSSVGIDQESHHQTFAVGSGSSTGSSNGTFAKQPAVSSKYPRGYPLASVGTPSHADRRFAFSRACRTVCSNSPRAFGWSSVRARSTSAARLVMIHPRQFPRGVAGKRQPDHSSRANLA